MTGAAIQIAFVGLRENCGCRQIACISGFAPLTYPRTLQISIKKLLTFLRLFGRNASMEQVPFGNASDAFGTNDFAENPEPRVPCVLLLDVSDSMQGDRIR